MKVVLAMEYVADALVAKLMTVDQPEDDCDITTVVTESSANFIKGLVMDANQKGATFCQLYKREGNLIWPLLLDNVRPDIMQWRRVQFRLIQLQLGDQIIFLFR